MHLIDASVDARRAQGRQPVRHASAVTRLLLTDFGQSFSEAETVESLEGKRKREGKRGSGDCAVSDAAVEPKPAALRLYVL